MAKDEWFDTPHNEAEEQYITDEYAPCDVEYPDESDQLESEKNYASRHKSTPDHEKAAEEVVTMHEKMYRMATKNGGSWLGGSENIGGSENRT